MPSPKLDFKSVLMERHDKNPVSKKKLFASPPDDALDSLMGTPVRDREEIVTPTQQERRLSFLPMPELVPSPTMSTGRGQDFFASNTIELSYRNTQHLLVQSQLSGGGASRLDGEVRMDIGGQRRVVEAESPTMLNVVGVGGER